MAARGDDRTGTNPDTSTDHRQSDLSRRGLLAAGVAAGGLGLAGVSTAADAQSEDLAAGRVAVGPRGATTVEFRSHITQTGTHGQQFKSFGYLTRVSHTRYSQLYADTPHDETTALLTAFATGALKARIHADTVHSLDIVGVLTVYQRRRPGARFSDPGSFRVGTVVARYDVVLQDVLAVFAPGQGLPTLTGDMVQTAARAMVGDLHGRTFGRVGTRLRMFATGLGTLLDPTTLNSELRIAGNWSVE